MAIGIAQLECLLDKLETLAARLRASGKPGQEILSVDDSLVTLAGECDFMLPSPLTVAALRETAERKISNVLVLLERAKQHQDMPADIRLAADNEDLLAGPSAQP